jgi:trimethylamine--corrinoid protein Co-methyltransferase
MLGSILSSLKGIDVSAATLNLESVDAVVHGEGHFLGQADTLQRMQSDFVYPKISDRRSIDEWESDGSKDIRTVARARIIEMLDDYYPDHISAELDRNIRSKFDIKLPEQPLKKR